MKNLMLAILGIVMSFYVLGTCLCVFSWEVRKNALDEHISRVLERTLEEEYGKKDIQRVREQLIKELTQGIDNYGRITVEIGALDLDKGIIQVVVKEAFRQVNGKERVLTCSKTVIMDGTIEEALQESLQRTTVSKSVATAGSSGVYTNAYDYYQEYEGKMIFKPTDDTEAGVYYGTRAKESSSGKLVFRTLGWRVTVRDKTGAIMDQVYYSINGEHIRVIDSRAVENYKYKLYNISLENLKSRMSEKAREALKKADCSIVFDACLTVVKNGVYQGGMTDDGIEWGKVYTTYDGIVNAQSWSAKTKEALKSYFNKEMADMFYEVKLSCGTGIASVSGGGKYCYGTEISIDATMETGYSFLEWVGGIVTSEKNYTFTVYEDIALMATTKRDDVAINLYRNYNASDSEKITAFYQFGMGSHLLPQTEWNKPGFYQSGWSTSRIVLQPYFKNGQMITEEWLERVAPSVNLYAVWEPNRYKIIYCSNGSTGKDLHVMAAYTDTINLPSTGYDFPSGRLGGWSLYSTQGGAEYFCGQEVSVAELAERAGVLDKNEGVIYLYAQQDSAPQIIGNSIYVSMWDANRGFITSEWLSQFVKVIDWEDGELLYESEYGAKMPDGGFGILEFQPEHYIKCTEETCIVERFYGRDSAGNEIYKPVEVYVVKDSKEDMTPYKGRVRFISSKYYKDDGGNWIPEEKGGLDENSIWRQKEEYSYLLDQLYLD